MVDYDMCEYLARTVGKFSEPHAAALSVGGNQTLSSLFNMAAGTEAATHPPLTLTLTDHVDGEFKQTAGSLEQLKYYLYGYVNPLLCAFGLVGNLLNIIVLTRRRMQAAMDSSMERTARYNLIALALSDMLYCAVTFPRTFLATQIVHQSHEVPQLYLRAYGSALQSIFMYTSTWLTVILAVGRYAAICRPIETRYLGDIKFTAAGISSAFILCIIFRLPSFWTFRIQRYDCSQFLHDSSASSASDSVYYYLDMGSFVEKKLLKTTFTYAWFICGYLVPVAQLLYCNAHLVYALRASQRVRALYRVSPKAPVTFSWRVTATLIAIVCMFIVLVSPAEILRFYYYAVGRKDAERFSMALVVTNVLLTGNFGCNFILYCAVNAHFRNTWCHCLKCATAAQQRRDSGHQGKCKRRYTFTSRSTGGSCSRRSGAGLIVHEAGAGSGVAVVLGAPCVYPCACPCPCVAGGSQVIDSRGVNVGCKADSRDCAKDGVAAEICRSTCIELARVDT